MKKIVIPVPTQVSVDGFHCEWAEYEQESFGRCEHLRAAMKAPGSRLCEAFSETELSRDNNGRLLRCAACLNAETAANEAED